MSSLHKIEVENLNAWYGHQQVLIDISMNIKDKAVTAIMGPSGCGKTTFIRCLNRMHELVPRAKVSGKVIFDGVNIYDNGVDPTWVRRRIGMVFQKPNPFPTLSVYDNVAFGPRIHGIRDRKLLDQIVKQSLEMAGLWEEVKGDLRRPASALSGGQQQRLCIARALALEPEVILMDEPTSHLDPISAAKIEMLIRKLAEKYAIVIVTHNVQQAARVSDYVAFFYMGKLIEYGPTKEVFERPKSELTERYVTGKFG